MKNKKFKKFNELTSKCYLCMIGASKDGSCWQKAFDLLKEMVMDERQKNPQFAPELEMLEDATDYEYDIQGWLEDCLDEMDMKGEYELILSMCNDLLSMFGWPDYTGSDLKFRKASALEALGLHKEAAQFCSQWIKKEPENIVAATAGVYAYMGTGELKTAGELVRRFILDESLCSDENDIMFTAASRLYEKTGNKEAKERVDQAIREYDEYLEKILDNMEEDFFDEEGELPFD